MTHRRTAHTARAIAIGLTAAGAWLFAVAWPVALIAWYLAAVCLWTGRCHARLARQCCPIGHSSAGAAHGPGCTRRVLPRRDTYRLDDADQAVFEEITRRYDHGTAA